MELPINDKPNYPKFQFQNLKETVEALDKIGHDYFIVLGPIIDDTKWPVH